jgi:3-oxoacyl-[acyl-carrier-protein] synthase-3
MKFDSLYIAGCGTWLPDRMTVAEAERAGLCDRRLTWRTEIASVCVAAEESAPQMAALAAAPALRQAGCGPTDIDLVLHADAYYQGHDLWPSAAYVQRAALGSGSRAPAIEIRQMSNGGMAAMELAASYLVADSARQRALITTGDRFCLPGFDRWRSDQGTVCGDGGTAIVLAKTGGFARLCSLVTICDSSLEKMSRGADPFGAAPFSLRQPIDLDGARADFIAEAGLEFVLEAINAGQRDVIDKALMEGEAKLSEIDWFVVPNLGHGRIKAHFLAPLGIEPERTTWAWGRYVGHLGAGDQIAGLAHLAGSRRLRRGQQCLLLGVGAGFSWSAAVVTIVDVP